jgi:Ca2+-binding EF-hand superfamily protein
MRSIVLAAVVVLALAGAPEQGTVNARAATAPDAQAGSKSQAAERQRFRAMDQNGDGAISRQEWRGSDQSFRVHDWNRDGVLSGAELGAAYRSGDANVPSDYDRTVLFNDWSAARFAALDRNRDGRLTQTEWLYDLDTFRRVDRNRDGVLIRSEFLGGDFDDDRGDRFDYLDVNGNNRVSRDEWHASPEAFTWLDRNRDGVLTRQEVEGDLGNQRDLFSRLDANNNNRINANEWQWSRASFDKLDVNNDGVLTRAEMAGQSQGQGDVDTVSINVGGTASDERWMDTGLYVYAGDRVRFQASGTVRMSNNEGDTSGPGGSNRLATDAPLPERPAGALIARVDTRGPIFVGNRTTPIPIGYTGRLYLSVNDDHLADNTGQYNVQITVQRRAP